MPISSYIYDLAPQSGDTTPHNEVTSGQVLSGTPTLVDLGGGVFAWEFTAASMATITGRTITYTGTGAGGGATLAVTYAVVSPPAAGDDRVFSWGSTTSPTDGPAIQIRRGNTGAGYRYPVVRESGFTAAFGAEVNEGNSSTTLRTMVVRLRTNVSGSEILDQWHSLNGTADTPDNSASSWSGTGTPNFQYLHVAASGAQTVRVHRLTIWPEELTNAECNSIRQNHDGALTPPSVLSGNIDLGPIVPLGDFLSVASSLSGNIDLGPIVAGGSFGQSPGSISISLVNESNAPVPFATLPWLTFQRVSDAAPVLALAGQTSDAAALVSVTNGALEAGTWYVVTAWKTDRTAAGIWFKQAA